MADFGHKWNPPSWCDHGRKHFADTSLPWVKTVKGTGAKKGCAKYHLRLSEQQIETIEMAVVSAEENEIQQVKPNVRAFWHKVPDADAPIGASLGRETSYVYVEYNSSGPVHGRPMTEAELRSKGAVL